MSSVRCLQSASGPFSAVSGCFERQKMEKRLSCLCLFPRSVFGSYKRTLVALQLFLRLLLFLEESLTSALGALWLQPQFQSTP